MIDVDVQADRRLAHVPFTLLRSTRLNFTMRPVETQGYLAATLVAAALGLAACGRASTVPAPASPEAAVRGFMNAVHANSIPAMSELWGSQRGPARSYMNRQELEQRLTIIRTYLAHEKFELLEPQGTPTTEGDRSVRVRLERNGCTPVVPFKVVPYHGGWLVADIDLAAAGNPARRCAPSKPSGEHGARGTSRPGFAFTR
jgi:hypothetical protein